MKRDLFRLFRLSLAIGTTIGIVAKLLGLLPKTVSFLLIVAPFLCFWGLFWGLGFAIVLIEIITQRELFNDTENRFDESSK